MSNSAVTVNASATLRGTGKVGGLTVNSGGTVGPGLNSPATLDSLGDVALNAGSTLNIRLNGTSVGINYDQLKVLGAVTLGGTLNVTAGFSAAIGDTFTLIENDGTDDTVGTFAGLPEGAILTLNGRPFKISYGGRGGLGGVFGRDVNDVTLEAVPAMAVWDGGGGQNKLWSTPQNWVGDVLPMPGDDVQFSNPGSGTLTTSNDFPAGRVLGSMIFAGGSHWVQGANLVDLHGKIQVTQPGAVSVAMPITLSASQHFQVDDAETELKLVGDINVGNHNLAVDATGSVLLFGALTGVGDLIKNGSGLLRILNTNSLPLTTVNAGTLYGAGRFSGKVVVNPGSSLITSSLFGGEFADVEVHGGILAPSDRVRVRGSLRMLEGSTFVEAVTYGNSGTVIPYAVVDQMVELNDCSFVLTIDSPFFSGGSVFQVNTGSVVGTFNGLPEGARFVADGRVVTITYTNGVNCFVGLPFVWDGGGNGNAWTTAANWVGDAAPLSGQNLVFPPGVSKLGTFNDFAPGTRFASLTFLAPSYSVAGNSLLLFQGISNQFSSGETVISSEVTWFGSSNEFSVGGSSTLRLEGSVTALGAFQTCQKSGTGTLRLGGTSANTQYRFDVLEGELELAKPSGVNAISGDLVIGDGANSAVVRLLDDHQIADTAEVEINWPARFELNGNNEVIERLEGDGAVELSERLQRLGRLTVESGNFSGSIIGGGGLTKVGITTTGLFATSVLRLLGTNTFTGMTILSGGLLVVEGIQTNSPIRLDGGVLTGRGFVGTITGGAGGLLDPGAGGGVISNALHSRSVALNSSTTFRAKLLSRDPGFENHKLQVTGSVSLGGSALDFYLVYPSYFIPASGDKFVLIENDGTDPVMGTFAGLPEGAVFTRPTPNLRWRITYAGGDGNDVMLTLVEIDLRPLITSFAVQTGSVPGVRFFTFSAFAVPNAYYDVEVSTNLMNWTRLFSVWVQSDGILAASSSLSQAPLFRERFFRFKQYPLEAPGAQD